MTSVSKSHSIVRPIHLKKKLTCFSKLLCALIFKLANNYFKRSKCIGSSIKFNNLFKMNGRAMRKVRLAFHVSFHKVRVPKVQISWLSSSEVVCCISVSTSLWPQWTHWLQSHMWFGYPFTQLAALNIKFGCLTIQICIIKILICFSIVRLSFELHILDYIEELQSRLE